jgi:hypothetical protein
VRRRRRCTTQPAHEDNKSQTSVTHNPRSTQRQETQPTEVVALAAFTLRPQRAAHSEKHLQSGGNRQAYPVISSRPLSPRDHMAGDTGAVGGAAPVADPDAGMLPGAAASKGTSSCTTSPCSLNRAKRSRIDGVRATAVDAESSRTPDVPTSSLNAPTWRGMVAMQWATCSEWMVTRLSFSARDMLTKNAVREQRPPHVFLSSRVRAQDIVGTNRSPSARLRSIC